MRNKPGQGAKELQSLPSLLTPRVPTAGLTTLVPPVWPCAICTARGPETGAQSAQGLSQKGILLCLPAGISPMEPHLFSIVAH